MVPGVDVGVVVLIDVEGAVRREGDGVLRQADTHKSQSDAPSLDKSATYVAQPAHMFLWYDYL